MKVVNGGDALLLFGMKCVRIPQGHAVRGLSLRYTLMKVPKLTPEYREPAPQHSAHFAMPLTELFVTV